MGHFGLYWLVWVFRLTQVERHLDVDSGTARSSGGEADVGVLRQRAGHAYLGAALAEDGQLSPSVHPAAGQ